MKYQLELTCDISLESRWHIGSGVSGGLTDKTVVVDQKQHAFIPASTLKGITRENCEKIAATLGFVNIKDPNDETGIENFLSESSSTYIVDRLFGSRFSGENLFFRNVYFDAKPGNMVITRHQRDRLSGTASPGRLYCIEETLPPESDIHCKLHLFTCHDESAITPARDEGEKQIIIADGLYWPFEYSLLLAGIQAIDRIGGGKSRGLGLFRAHPSMSLTLNGHKVSQNVETLVGYLATPAGLLAGDQSIENVLKELEWLPKPKLEPELPLVTVVANDMESTCNVRVTVKPLSGVSISRNRSSRMSEILDYIPGSTFRGALARLYLDNYGQDSKFAAFVDGKNLFADLLPSVGNELNSVAPATAISCKREPGVDGHGVHDLLFYRAGSYLESLEASIFRQEPKELAFCSKCGNMLKKLGENNAYVRKSEPSRAFYMHVGMDRLTQTISPQILYGIESLQPDSASVGESEPECLLQFVGVAVLKENFFERIKKLCDSGRNLRLGRAKGKGYGEAVWKIEREEKSGDDFERRLRDFSEGFRQYCKSLFSIDLPKKLYFSLGMQSHAIIVDKWLRYTCHPQAVIESLQSLDCDPVWYKASMVQIRGWQQKHGLPKEDEFGIERGSVYMFATDKVDSSIERLRQIEQTSIGLRGEEGFGRLVISNHYHLEHRVGGKK